VIAHRGGSAPHGRWPGCGRARRRGVIALPRLSRVFAQRHLAPEPVLNGLRLARLLLGTLCVLRGLTRVPGSVATAIGRPRPRGPTPPLGAPRREALHVRRRRPSAAHRGRPRADRPRRAGLGRWQAELCWDALETAADVGALGRAGAANLVFRVRVGLGRGARADAKGRAARPRACDPEGPAGARGSASTSSTSRGSLARRAGGSQGRPRSSSGRAPRASPSPAASSSCRRARQSGLRRTSSASPSTRLSLGAISS